MLVHIRVFTANRLGLQFASRIEQDAVYLLVEHGAYTPNDMEQDDEVITSRAARLGLTTTPEMEAAA